MNKKNKLWDLRLKVNVLLNFYSVYSFFILIIISFFIISCSHPKDIVGTYRCCKGQFWSSKYINLRADSTFSHSQSYCLGKDSTSGRWSLNNKVLTLTTYRQLPTIFSDAYQLAQEKLIDSDSIIIKIIDKDNEPVPFRACGLVRKGKITWKETDLEGTCKFNISNYDSIVFGIRQNKLYFSVNNSKTNYYIFKDVFNYYELEEFFTNEKWKVRNNFLVAPQNKYYKIKIP